MKKVSLIDEEFLDSIPYWDDFLSINQLVNYITKLTLILYKYKDLAKLERINFKKKPRENKENTRRNWYSYYDRLLFLLAF